MVNILRLENQHENKELLESLDIVLADFSRSMDAISRSLNDNSRVGPAILDPPLPPHFRTVRARRTRAVGYHIYKNYYDWDPYGYDSESESDSESGSESESPASGSCSPTATTPSSTFSETCGSPGTSYTSGPASPIGTPAIKSLADSTTTAPSSPTKSSASINSPLIATASCDDGNERNDFHSAAN